MASEWWPAELAMPIYAADTWTVDPVWPIYEVNYLHCGAARAWQAFRDWCDGTAEQWRRMVMHGRASFTEGVEFGRTLR